MRTLALTCCLAALGSAPAQAGLTTEGAFAFAARDGTNINSSSPTYTLVTTSMTPLSPLAVYFDTRGTGLSSNSALKFALASVVPAGQSIVAATLTFNVQGSQTVTAVSPVLSISGFTADANAVSLADFNLPTTGVGTTPALGNTGFGGATLPAFTFDVTSFLQTLQGSGATSAGFRFDDFGGNVFINAPNDATASLQPTLSITYAATVPEPASAALATLGGAIALAAARRRRGSMTITRSVWGRHPGR